MVNFLFFVGKGLSYILLLMMFALGWIYFCLPNVKGLAESNPTTTSFIKRSISASNEQIGLEWRDLKSISTYLQHAVLLAEDADYWSHGPFNWSHIARAVKINLSANKIVTGGSSISQQVAKNLFLSSQRTWIRKLQEAFLTIELERHLSKERIFEIYLNIVEWGPGIFGAEAAARHWFGIGCDQLNPRQAAQLALTLASPATRTPLALPSHVAAYTNRLLLLMLSTGKVTHEEIFPFLHIQKVLN